MFSYAVIRIASASESAIKMVEDLGLSFRTMLVEWDIVHYFRLILITMTFTMIFSIMYKMIEKQRMLPPGPWGLPFLGSLPFTGEGSPHSWYLKLAARYGDLMSVKLGSNLVVCISSARLLRDLFNRPESTDRPHTPLNNLMGGRGIVLSEGLLWKKQRQFLFEKFRVLGVKLWNYERFESCIMVEIKEFISSLEAAAGEPVNPAVQLGRHVHNVICQLMMSFRFAEHDPEFLTFNERVSKGMELFGSIYIGEHVPAYLYLPGKKAVLEEIGQNLRSVSEFHIRHVRRRQELLARERREPSDLLDHYLLEIQHDTDSGSKLFHGVDPVDQIVQVMNDLFSAGMETSRTTLVWTLVMMLREPAVADKVRHELEQVLEPGALVKLEHRLKLPYLEAVIFETLRIVSVVPLGTTHVNSTAWQVGDYTIPAGSHLVPLLNKINMDPELFPEPHKFTPERFIRHGVLHLPDTFLPFGVGRRVCLGEQLARIELFLFFANMMNNFEFSLPEGQPMPELEGFVGTTHAPLPFNLHFWKIDMDERYRG